MHLTELEIATFIEKKSSKKQREKVLNHLSSCTKCYDEFAEVYEIINNSAQQDSSLSFRENYIRKAENFVGNVPQAKSHFAYGKKSQVKRLALAFTIAAFAISIILFQTKAGSKSVKYRSANNVTTLHLLTPEDLSVTNSNQLNFSWSSIRGTKYYILKIYDTIGNTVFEKSITNIHIQLTKETKLLAGKKYLWQVSALLNNGKKIGSKLYAFTFKK